MIYAMTGPTLCAPTGSRPQPRRRVPGDAIVLRFILRLMVLVVLAVQPAVAQDKPAYPAIDRAWTSADYRDLIELIKSGKSPLPALADAAGRPVFERIVSLDNFAMPRDTKLPLTSRLQEMLAMFDASRTLLLDYLVEAQKGKPYERELAKLQVFLLAESSTVLALVDEFLPTIPKDDTYPTRMAGLERMRQGLRTIVSGAIESTGETQFYSKASTIELAQGIATYLPSFWPILSAQDREDFARRIGRQIDATTDAEIKAALSALKTVLEQPA